MEFILLLILLILLMTAALAGISFAPWVPTWRKDFPRVFKLAELKPGQVFYELGCGDGRVVTQANKIYKAKAIGLEISMPLYLVAKLRQLFNPNKDLKIKYKNLFKENLGAADVVYFFGMPKPVKDKLRLKLEKELKPGCRVISYVFPIEGWQPEVIDKPLANVVPIYLYIR
jgi:SAM-dependent methyltransferase